MRVGPSYQGVFVGRLGDVVAPQRGERDALDVVEADLGGERPVVGLDLVVDLARSSRRGRAC